MGDLVDVCADVYDSYVGLSLFIRETNVAVADGTAAPRCPIMPTVSCMSAFSKNESV